MGKELNGQQLSKFLYNELKTYTLSKKNKPSIVDISVGKDFGSLMYARIKQKTIEKATGFHFESKYYEKITVTELIKDIKQMNNDNNINSIMIQLPLPSYLSSSERLILDSIDETKDVDGLTSRSLGKLLVGSNTLVSCTSLGIVSLLKAYNIKISGQQACIVSRSNLIGKPLEQLLLKENATTTVCHSKTKDLEHITKKADILIVAMNKQEYITEEYVKKGAIIIDVGVHKNTFGETVGDVNYQKVYSKVKGITPSINGVGPMTICMLAYNAAKSVYGIEIDALLERSLSKYKNNYSQN